MVQEALAAVGSNSGRPQGTRPRPLRTTRRLSSRSRSPSGPDRDEPGLSESRKEEAYSRARKSLRLWPVSREGDLRERTIEYLINELLLDQQHAVGLDFEVRRVGGARNRDPGSKAVKDEVLVTFASVRERDDIKSFAKNLERRGRGLRLEIPDHLWSSFRVLQKTAYELKQRNGDLKRNVLFDDEKSDLKIDVC